MASTLGRVLTANTLSRAQSSWYKTGLMILVVTALISLNLLLVQVMGDRGSNEVDVLPLARHYVDPEWVSKDWYLNQQAGYRILFQSLFGWLTVIWGFLATCLIGRLLCYGLVASGIVFIGRILDLKFPLLLLAVVLFLGNQSVAAGEWLVGGLEAKSVAYSLVLLAIGLMLEGRYLQMALMLGVATSFHVLVGIWASLAALVLIVLRQKNFLRGVKLLALLVAVYLVAGVFGVGAAMEQLLTPTPVDSVVPSQIYVFLRLSHHLNPLSWPASWWVQPTFYMLLLAVVVGLFWRQQVVKSFRLSKQHIARLELAKFTIISMIPFMLGLAIAPFDAEGSLLQYYPFRLGDVMLPLSTCLLSACALQEVLIGRARQMLLIVCILFLSWKCTTEFSSFKNHLLALREPHTAEQNIDPQWRELCTWVRIYTSQDATVVTPPVEFSNFTWLAERSTVAKFKLLPQSKAGILAWYKRMSDLGGDISHWLEPVPSFSTGGVEQALTSNYNHLSTAQSKALMSKYQADYLVAHVENQLELPVVYSNSQYVLYGR